MGRIGSATAAHESGAAPLNYVEGFVRQIIGWREFIRRIYRHKGPGYRKRDEFDQHGTLPNFYWAGETDMACMRDCLGQVLTCGYGHHIQRLMVRAMHRCICHGCQSASGARAIDPNKW